MIVWKHIFMSFLQLFLKPVLELHTLRSVFGVLWSPLLGKQLETIKKNYIQQLKKIIFLIVGTDCFQFFPILFQKNTTQILVEPKRILRKIRVIRSLRKESFVVEDGDALHGDFSLQKLHNVIWPTNLLADSHLRYDVLSLKRHRNVIPFCGHEIFSREAEIFFWEAGFFKNLVDFFR